MDNSFSCFDEANKAFQEFHAALLSALFVSEQDVSLILKAVIETPEYQAYERGRGVLYRVRRQVYRRMKYYRA